MAAHRWQIHCSPSYPSALAPHGASGSMNETLGLRLLTRTAAQPQAARQLDENPASGILSHQRTHHAPLTPSSTSDYGKHTASISVCSYASRILAAQGIAASIRIFDICTMCCYADNAHLHKALASCVVGIPLPSWQGHAARFSGREEGVLGSPQASSM